MLDSSACIDRINNNQNNQSTSPKKDVHKDLKEEIDVNRRSDAGHSRTENEVADKAPQLVHSKVKTSESDAHESTAPIKNCEWYASDLLSGAGDESVQDDDEQLNYAAAANVDNHLSSKLTTSYTTNSVTTTTNTLNDCHSIGSDNSPNSTGNYRQTVLSNFSLWFSEISTGASLFQNFLLSNPFRRRNSRQSAANSPSITRSNSKVLSPTDNHHHHLADNLLGKDQQKRETASESARGDLRNKNKEEEDDEEDSEAVRKFIGAIQPTLKGKELIELANFGVVEIDGHEPGLGHRFEIFTLDAHTFCDNCSEFIWTPIIHHSNTISAEIVSPYSKTVRCINCKYTCHYRCTKFIRINCQKSSSTMESVKSDEQNSSQHASLSKQSSASSQSEDNDQASRSDSPLFFERGVLEEKIQKYNQRIAHRGSGLGIYLLDDGKTFRGFLRVQINLSRPINVISGTRPPSIYDIINDEEVTSRRTLTTFYMPRDTVKNIHINSLNTSLDVIRAMLKKFKMVDKSLKFALYRKYTPDPKSTPVLSRIGDQDHPLRIALEWLDSEDKQIVLQENDLTEINWSEFQLPELNNFIKILDKEEEDHLVQVKLKYEILREELDKIVNYRNMFSNAVYV